MIRLCLHGASGRMGAAIEGLPTHALRSAPGSMRTATRRLRRGAGCCGCGHRF